MKLKLSSRVCTWRTGKQVLPFDVREEDLGQLKLDMFDVRPINLQGSTGRPRFLSAAKSNDLEPSL